MQSDPTIRLKKILFIGGGLLGVIAITSIIWFIATHGFISVQNMSGDTLSIVNINGTLNDPKQVKNGAFVGSATYAVRNDIDGRLRMITVAVPGWLQTAKVTLDNPTNHPIQRVAALTDGALVGQVGALHSYDENAQILSEVATHPNDDLFGIGVDMLTLPKQLSQVELLNSTSLVGFSPSGGEEAQSLELNRYDVTNNSYTKLTDKAFNSQNLTLIASQSLGSDGVVVFDKSDSSYTYYKNNAGTKITLQTPAAMNGSHPIVDINGDTMAVLSGENYSPPASDTPATAVKKDSVITLYDLTTGTKTNSYQISKSNTVSNITVSQDGSVAVINNDLLWVYTKSGALTLVNPFNVVSQTFWRDNTNLYAVSAEKNISHIDTQKRQLTAAFGSDTLSLSNAHLAGNLLYFTSFNDKNTVTRLPDGYVIDLAATVGNNDSEKIINNLPIYNDDYRINVMGGVVTIQLLVSSREEAPDKAKYDDKVAILTIRARLAVSDALGSLADKYTIRVVTPLD